MNNVMILLLIAKTVIRYVCNVVKVIIQKEVGVFHNVEI